jgi:hypothetical protein
MKVARRSRPKPADALPVLARLGAEGTVGLSPPAGEAAIRQMQAAAKRDLGGSVPDGFVAFLRVANGACFKAAEDMVPENLDIDHPEVIVLGNDGNSAYYVFDKRDGRFHTINLGFPDERYESYDSFDEMLIGVLRGQQVL